MAVLKYAVVGNPVITKPAQGQPQWRLATNTDRVKWLCPPFDYETFDDGEIVLRRRANPPHTGNVDEVRFLVFRSQQEAVGALIRGEAHCALAITDPDQVERVKKAGLSTWEALSQYNLHYLGFRTDMQPFHTAQTRRGFISALDVPAALNAARISDWRAHGLLPGIPGDGLYENQSPTPLPPDLDDAINKIRPKLLYNANERIDKAIAEDLKRQQPSLRLVAKDGYRQLVEGVQSAEGHLFLYNWFIKENNVRRVLHPLFHSKFIPNPNLTRYDDADGEIDELLNVPPIIPRNALARIYHDAPVFVLYHAYRTAAWQVNVQGLDNNLTDPECHPIDKLDNVNVL